MEVEMNTDPILERAAKWFQILNNPASATYRIAHSQRKNTAPMFEPEEVLNEIRRTSDEGMRELGEAVEDLMGPKPST